MKIKNLILFCAAIFLAACSDKEDIGNNTYQTQEFKKLNIKDAKYIYGSENDSRSLATEYRQIKKDGTDTTLGWITEKGDTILLQHITGIWDINEKYLMVNMYDAGYQKDENGIIISEPSICGCSYLIDKKTEAVFKLKGYVTIESLNFAGEVYIGLNGGKAMTDNNGNIYMPLHIPQTTPGSPYYLNDMLFKINIQDPSNIKVEKYAEIYSEEYYQNYDHLKYDWFVVNNQGTCFYDMRYIRPASGTLQYTIGQFIEGSTYGAGFVSPDRNDLYLTAIGGQENDSYLTITKLLDNGNDLQGEEVVKIPISFYEPEYRICTLWNQFKSSTLIMARNFYEFNMDDYSISQIDADLTGFFKENSYTTTTASFIQNSVDKLTIVSLRDYSTKTVDMANVGIDLRNIYTMDGSEFLHFSGFRYVDSQSVIGTIDENGNVAISETLPVNKITTIVQIK